MHKILNFVSFPLLMLGSILLSHVLLEYNFYENDKPVNSKTSNQINNLLF